MARHVQDSPLESEEGALPHEAVRLGSDVGPDESSSPASPLRGTDALKAPQAHEL